MTVVRILYNLFRRTCAKLILS